MVFLPASCNRPIPQPGSSVFLFDNEIVDFCRVRIGVSCAYISIGIIIGREDGEETEWYVFLLSFSGGAFVCYNLRRGGGLDCGCAPRGATPLSAWVTLPLVLSPVCALLGPYYACAQNDSIPPGYAAISLGDCAFGIDLSLHLTWIGLCSRSCIQDKTAPACYASITLGDCAFGFESRLFLDAGQITQSCFCAKEGAVSF